MSQDLHVDAAVRSIEDCLRDANSYYDDGLRGWKEDEFNDDHAIAKHYVERAFVGLIVLAEQLGLSEVCKQVSDLYKVAKKDLLESEMGLEEPYLTWCEKIRMYLDGIAEVHGLGDSVTSEVRDLKQIIKRSLYVICDTDLFSSPPASEADVHDRIEGILKCHFPDLKRKPALTKPIKNFEPDTGIRSIRTLIEYKFVTSKSEARRVVDEVLADSRAYRTPHWDNYLFVIYETRRVMPEEEWKRLFKECDLGEDCDAIVLSGDAGRRKKAVT